MDPRKALLAATLAFPLPALAQEEVREPIRIIITKVDCSRLMGHTPSADVAYKAGEGAGGRKVRPADMPGSGADAVPGLLPDVLEIPLNIKPLANAGWAKHGLADTQSSLGTVRYDVAKGTFTLNGQPLTSPEQEELAKACAKRGVR